METDKQILLDLTRHWYIQGNIGEAQFRDELYVLGFNAEEIDTETKRAGSAQGRRVEPAS